jgi:serine/threonine-protein kinase RsbW
MTPTTVVPSPPGPPLSTDITTAVVLEQSVPATLTAVSQLCEDIERLFAGHAGDAAAGEVRLGLMESLVNIVRHGFEEPADQAIGVRCIAGPQRWCFIVFDQGRPIPADRFRAADGTVFEFDPDDIESIPEGGMGLSLIRAVFDQVAYRATAEGNELLLTKHLAR